MKWVIAQFVFMELKAPLGLSEQQTDRQNGLELLYL